MIFDMMRRTKVTESIVSQSPGLQVEYPLPPSGAVRLGE